MADARRPRKKKAAPGAADGLRRQAEERLDGLSAAAAPAPEDAAAVVHELRVHQTELEVQNEELRRAQFDLDAQLEKYLELFDLAPVGYVALDDPGIVRDANLTAAHLLGVERQQLVGRPLSAFILTPDRDVYYLHLRSLRETGWPQSCELRLRSAGAQPFWAHLEWRPQGVADGGPLRYHLTFTDVHERVLAEEALRESEAEFRNVVEGATDGIAILQGGLVTFVNEALARMAGYSVGELTGASFLVVVQEEQRAKIAERVRRRIAGEQMPTSYELDLVRKDGTPFTVEVSAGVVTYEGAPAELVLLRDITARKQAQEALRESEERFALALEGAGAGLWDWDMVKDQVVYSTQWKRMLGYEDHEVEDAFSGWKDLWHPDDRPRIEEALDDYLSGKTSDYEIVHRLRHKDGTWRWIVTRGGIIRDPAGKPLRWVGTNTDISERKQAEEALRQSEERHKEMIAGISDVIAIMAVDGTLRYKSPNIERHFGWLPEDLVGTNGWETVHPDDLERIQGEFLALLDEHDSVVTVEYRYKCKDGGYKTIELTATNLTNSPLIDGVLMNYHDITERKQAEDEIQRLNAELEERVITRTAQRDAFNRELEAFAYSAAHDLRAPLRAIDGFSKIVIDDAAERLTPEEVEHLERVRAAAQRMAQMIDDLMGLSKVTRRPLLRREVDVSATAREVAEELRAAQPRRRVEVVVAPGMTAAADPALLRLVLVQLLDNAWKFTSHHDAARIEVGVAIADADADGGGGDGAGDAGAGVGDDGAGREERVFFVRDDGAGFDMAYAKQLFGAFQRFHAAGEFEGGGIGLAMVQRLVLRHGGRVWAAAEVEKGATFFFTLPEAELAAD